MTGESRAREASFLGSGLPSVLGISPSYFYGEARRGAHHLVDFLKKLLRGPLKELYQIQLHYVNCHVPKNRVTKSKPTACFRPISRPALYQASLRGRADD